MLPTCGTELHGPGERPCLCLARLCPGRTRPREHSPVPTARRFEFTHAGPRAWDKVPWSTTRHCALRCAQTKHRRGGHPRPRTFHRDTGGARSRTGSFRLRSAATTRVSGIHEFLEGGDLAAFSPPADGCPGPKPWPSSRRRRCDRSRHRAGVRPSRSHASNLLPCDKNPKIADFGLPGSPSRGTTHYDVKFAHARISLPSAWRPASMPTRGRATSMPCARCSFTS